MRQLRLMNETEVNAILRNSTSLKPADLIITDLKWKYLVRAVLRAKNIMIVGASGCAKTMTAQRVAKSFFVDREEIVSEDQLNILKNSLNIKIQKIEEI